MKASNGSSVSWSDLSASERAAAKIMCESSHLFFTRLMFKERQGDRFRLGPHHEVICNTLDRVISGEIDRLIISVPPGYTKTEAAVIAFIARGLAITKGRARFIHASYSLDLVAENSTSIKDTMGTTPFQEMWGISLRADMSGKGRWKTDEGGGLLAKPAGGPITGFRAGTMEPGFTGALVIDDPIKPDDAKSTTERTHINKRWHSTFKSRLAVETVPVVVIMQRLHTDDFSGYLLKGGAHCLWHHLLLPAEVDNSLPYPKEWTHGVPIGHGLPDGPLWPEKHGEEALEILRADDYTFAAQYLQRPTAEGGNLFKAEWLRDYRAADLPEIEWRGIYADTAQKTGQQNDFSVLQCWGKGRDGRAYLLDQLRGKFEAPELLVAAHAFWKKHVALTSHALGPLRSMAIEDKVSGTGLIQQMGRKGIPIVAIKRDRDKLSRGRDVLPIFAADLVRLPHPDEAPWRPAYDLEILSFTGMGDGHDDQVDPTIDAVSEMCIDYVPLDAWV